MNRLTENIEAINENGKSFEFTEVKRNQNKTVLVRSLRTGSQPRVVFLHVLGPRVKQGLLFQNDFQNKFKQQDD